MTAATGIDPLAMIDPHHAFWTLLDKNPAHPIWRQAENNYRVMRTREAEQFNDRSVIEQWLDSVNRALSQVTRLVIQLIADGHRFERTLPGDIKKRINSRKKAELGALEKDAEMAKRHYCWLTALEAQLLKEGLPQWLV